MNSITNFHIPTTVVMQSCISASFVIFAPLCAFVWPCAVVLLLIREVEGESTHNLSDCNSRNVFSLDRSENPAQFSNHYYLLTGKVVGAPCGLSIGRLSCRQQQQQQALQKRLYYNQCCYHHNDGNGLLHVAWLLGWHHFQKSFRSSCKTSGCYLWVPKDTTPKMGPIACTPEELSGDRFLLLWLCSENCAV